MSTGHSNELFIMPVYPSSLDVNLELSVSWSEDSESLARSAVVMQTGWEKRCPGWACLLKHPGLQLAEMLVLSYCVQKLLIVLCGGSSVVSASPDKAEGWGWEVLTRGKHKADLLSYPPPERKDCLLFVFWLVCIWGTCNNTHRVNPLSDTCCCLI